MKVIVLCLSLLVESLYLMFIYFIEMEEISFHIIDLVIYLYLFSFIPALVYFIRGVINDKENDCKTLEGLSMFFDIYLLIHIVLAPYYMIKFFKEKIQKTP